MMGWKRINDQWATWHVGQPIPDFKQRVVTVQLDGHELDMLYLAMDRAYVDETSQVKFSLNAPLALDKSEER